MSGRVEGRPGSPTALRDQNRARVVEELRKQGQATQADLARATGLAPATISNIVRDLAGAGSLRIEKRSGKRNSVRLTGGTGFVVGVDHGHRHVTVGISDLAHQVVAQTRTELPVGLSAAQSMDHAARLLDKTLVDAGIERAELVGAAMGLPAPIDRTTGRVGSPSILPGWVGIDASSLATTALGLPTRVIVDNDANLGALAEHQWGAGTGTTDMVYLKLSEGVGAGLIVGGRLYAGVAGTAGEIGHTTVDEFGAVCRCGNRGCLETLVSARYVVSLLAPTEGELSIEEVVRRAIAGDRAFVRVLDDVGRQVGAAVAGLCSILNPELLVLGGELAQAAQILIPSIQQVVDRCGVPSAAAALRIRPALLGPQTHLLGAIARAIADADRSVFMS
ncbi:ROK family protein [Nocardia sp. NPDC058666]|uniref:ROK family transcriptional regulator n=1 Tax=Nocardia sp. NPDC058666 TaxID=3346587 RepID=UPI00364C54DE